jgi:hypothetical protein
MCKYTAFGKFTAQELASLADEMAKYYKRNINKAILEAQMRTINTETRQQ